MILAPVVRGRKGEYKKDLEKYLRQGFMRARIDGDLRALDEDIPLDRRKNHTIGSLCKGRRKCLLKKSIIALASGNFVEILTYNTP